jgi:trimeric autotransporter adhesin
MSTSVKSIPVPSSGFGPAVDVSSLVGEKTVVLSGRFRGAYVLYGSHQSGPGARFAPLLIFNAGGIEGVKQTFKISLAQVKLKSLATGATGVSVNISGLLVPGDNSFTSVGVGGVLDLGSDAFQVDLNFMGFGVVNGAVVVEGSLDGMSFNPLGNFSSSLASPSLLGGGAGIEFSPIVCSDRIRYVRLNVQGSASSGFVVTVGGAVSEGGSGAVGTLAATYDAGSSPADQTMTIADVEGGMVVFDASEGGFSGPDVVQVVVPDGIGAAFKMDGGMRLGFNPGGGNVLINCSDSSPLLDPAITANVVIGDGALQNDSTSTGFSVVIGSNANAPGGCVVVGDSSGCDQGSNVAVGAAARCLTRHNPLLADTGNVSMGFFCMQTGGTSVTVGNFALSFGDSIVCIGNQAEVGTSLVDNSWGTAIGAYARSLGDQAIALGTNALATEVSGIAIGGPSEAHGNRCIAIGSSSSVYGTGVDCMAVGPDCDVSGSGNFNAAFGPELLVGDGGVAEIRAFGYNALLGSWSRVFATNSVSIGFQANIGATSDSEITDSDISMGNVCVIGGTVGGVPINNGIAIGNGAFIVNIVDVEGNLGTTNNAIAIGTGANTNEEASIAIGHGATVSFSQPFGEDATGDIVIGDEAVAKSSYGGVVVIGANAHANALGSGNPDNSVVVGSSATVDYIGAGHQNCVVVGGSAKGLGDACVAVGSGSKGGTSGVSVGASCDTSAVSNAVVVGYQSQATGNYGMAFGSGVTAGANEVVFGSSHNVVKFRAVSGLASNADLFTFDQSLVSGGADTTSMRLLIQKHSGGAIASVPVTLSAIDGHGNSYLQVANS